MKYKKDVEKQRVLIGYNFSKFKKKRNIRRTRIFRIFFRNLERMRRTFLNSRKRYIEILNIFRIFLSRFSKFKKNEEKRRAFWLDINFLNLRKKENFSNISSKFGKNENDF